MMTVQTEIVNLTTATTSLLNEVITKKSVLDEAEGKATAALDATKVSEAAAKASEIEAKTSENNAKTQADSAKTEADRAKQISGLSTVSDAIGLAALPLPDVWAPLSDSLRMITGYGREVKVGGDVVARMANFSRSTTRTYTAKYGTLKIAAINEPCFEKEGLHLDVQSTNMIPISNFPQNLAGWSTPNPTGNLYSYVAAPDGTSSAVKVSFAGDGFNQPFPSLVVGTVYTFSFYAKNETATDVNVAIRLGNGDLGAIVRIPANTAWTRYSVTRTFQAGDTVLRWYFNTKGVEVSLWGAQLESLAWASSYIPTDGAAVTRAADLLQFIGPGNHPDVLPGVPFTFAMRMSCEDAETKFQRDVLICPNVAWSLLRRAGSTIRYYRDGSGQLSISAPGKKMNVIAVKVTAENSCTLRVGASQATRTEVLNIGRKVTTVDITNVAGHVRDFRIWQHALTDEQFKAIS